MKLSSTRARLLSGVAMGLGMMVFTAQPAAAACNVTTTNNPGDTIDCANTVTTDTVNPPAFPATDRAYNFGADPNPIFVNIDAGQWVQGFGLAILSNAGPNTLTITNNGTIQVNGGNTPTAGGGDGALFVTVDGSPLTYGGTGNILNLGTGDGFEVVLNGTASLDANIGGSIGTNLGDGINVTANAGSAGAINITTTAGRVIAASGGDGIHVQTAGSGDVTIDSNANIANGIALDLQNAIFVNSTGTGDINITHLSGGVSDEAQQDYIHATINNAASAGNIDITLGGGGTFNSAGDGIRASSIGTGNITIDSSDAAINAASDVGSGIAVTSNAGDIFITSGEITAIGGIGSPAGIFASSGTGAITIDALGQIIATANGIFATSQGGAVTVNAGDVTSTNGLTSAIFAQQQNAVGAGDVTVTTTGAVSAANGIDVLNSGLGDVTVTTGAGLVTGTTGFGLSAGINNPGSSGNVLVDIGTGGVMSLGVAVNAFTRGSGSVTVNSLGDITSTIDFGINAQSTGSGAVTVDATGAVSAGLVGIAVITQGGAATVTAGDVTSTGADAIIANQADVNGTGNVTVTTSGAVSGANGIDVLNSGLGDVTVTTGAGLVTGTTGFGLSAGINNPGSSGNVLVDIGTGGVMSLGVAVNAFTRGSGSVTVNSLGDITSTIDFGINAQSTGSGAVTVDATGAVSAGLVGIAVITQGGSITVAAGDVTSTGADAIVAQQFAVAGDGDIIVNANGVVSGTVGIDTFNAGSGDITITTGAGLVTGTAGSGISADMDNPASAGNILVDIGTGGVSAPNGSAVDIATVGSGTVTVNSVGVVTGDAAGTGDGMVIRAASGATLVNVTGGSVTGAADGIDASSIDGTIDVVLSGGADVTGTNGIGILLTSAGAKSIDVGAGSVVNGGLDAINAGGGSTLTITNAGTIGPAVGIMITSDLLTATTITNLTGGILNGGVGLSDQADVITNGGTWNASGGNAFNGGVDIVTNAAGGVINSATGTVFSDLEDLVTLGGSSFNVAGTLDFANVATSLTNGGALVLADGAAVTGLGVIMSNGTIEGGAGSSLSNLGNVTNLAGGVISTSGDFTLTTTGDFANAGMLDLAPALFTLAGATSFTNSGTINAIGGATDLVIPGLLDNSGAINLSNGVVGDVLTLTGDYVGSGNAVLNLDVTSQSATDRLVVVGAVSGTTSLNVNPVGSVITGTDGILVVDADTSTADAFVLGSTGAGLVNYSLLQQGADYYLIGLLNTNAFAPLLLDGVATDLWHQSADVVGTHLALKRQALGAGAGRSGLWGRFYWGRDRSGARHTQNLFGDDLVVDQRVETGRTGAQLGFDYKTGGAVIGFTAGYEHAGAEHVATSTGLKAGGYNLGVYGLLGSDTGFYGSLLAKYDHGQARLTNNALFDGVGKLSLDSWGVDGKAGYRWATGGGRLDVGGGLTWVRSSIEDFTVSGIDYDFATARSLRGQIGVRYEGRDSYGPYVDARLLHEFKDSNDVSLRSGTELDVARAEGRGTWGRLEVGVAPHGKSGPTAAIWAQVGDAHGIGVQAGWKF